MSFDFGRMMGGGGRRERRRMSVAEARPLLEEAEVERLFPQVGGGKSVCVCSCTCVGVCVSVCVYVCVYMSCVYVSRM